MPATCKNLSVALQPVHGVARIAKHNTHDLMYKLLRNMQRSCMLYLSDILKTPSIPKVVDEVCRPAEGCEV